ncbi:MAG: S8 family peptidase [Deltaproteobacteria bacterium]
MSDQPFPLLLFPRPGVSERESRRPAIPGIRRPSFSRQRERLTPVFHALQSSFESRNIQLQTTTPGDDPERVLVFETVGSTVDFIKAVRRTPGLEWLLETEEQGIEPDEDFYDSHHPDNPINGKLFLLGSNRQGISEIISLWNRYQENPKIKFATGLNPWKEVFAHLKDVRFWGAQDRIDQEIRHYWESMVSRGDDQVWFEIEAWCYSSTEKNERSAEEILALVASLNGRILSRALLPEIAYHGFLVEMPAANVRRLMDSSPPELVLSDRVMLFRPRGQAMALPEDDGSRLAGPTPPPLRVSGDPVVAILDGLPLQNHPLLAGRMIIDDPDGWEEYYEARDRVHGTAMASLIVLGELDGPRVPLTRPIYVRPILRTNPADFQSPREEVTPGDVLLIDLVHRSVRRLYEEEGGEPPAAPSVKVINLSVGDPSRPFDLRLSPWARLIDWLSCRYGVMFIVSTGNIASDLLLPTPRGSFSGLAPEERTRLATNELLSNAMDRRLIAPAESINAFTVGAVHTDYGTIREVTGRYDLFVEGGVTPYSRIGHGFRRSVKPDVMLPGGRFLLRERLPGPVDPNSTTVEIINVSGSPPGQRVAAPPSGGGENTRYSRGTSNAAALASRGAAWAYEVIEALRTGNTTLLPRNSDAVLLKALLAHGAEWGGLKAQVTGARPDLTDWRKKEDLVARFVGYGLADIDRALTCTEQRATLIGVGSLRDGEALEYRAPMPPSLIAMPVKRRLTTTLAWLTPINAVHARYRSARLWMKSPLEELDVKRINCREPERIQRGTLQHEVCEGDSAIAFVDGDELVFKINCMADAGKLSEPVPFALCVSLEVAEGIDLPIYQEIRERVQARVTVHQ